MANGWGGPEFYWYLLKVSYTLGLKESADFHARTSKNWPSYKIVCFIVLDCTQLQCFKVTGNISGEKIKGRVIGTTLGYVQYCSFSPNDSLVAVCTGFDVVILQSAVSVIFKFFIKSQGLV